MKIHSIALYDVDNLSDVETALLPLMDAGIVPSPFRAEMQASFRTVRKFHDDAGPIRDLHAHLMTRGEISWVPERHLPDGMVIVVMRLRE